MNQPLISIIIVNYNGKTYLEKCLDSLSKITYKNYEIILVDNNSEDDSIEFVKKHYPLNIIIKLDRNYGYAYPNNVGAKNAKGELLLFLNNDTWVDSKFISEMINVLNHDKNIAICQSLILQPNGEVDSSGDFIDEIGVSFSSKEKVDDTRTILSAKGASMLVRKDVFESLGGFDEKFFVSFEDVDFGWRSWILGYRAVVCPKSIVSHVGGQTIKDIKPEIIFHGLKNQISMKITNFENTRVFKSLVLFFILYGFRMLKVFFDYKLHGKTKISATNYEDRKAEKPNIKNYFKVLYWIFRNFNYLRKKHKLVNSTRKYTTRQLEKMNIIQPRK